MKLVILSLLGILSPGFAWAIINLPTTGAPEIPAGMAAIIVAGLTAGVLFIRSRRPKRKQ